MKTIFPTTSCFGQNCSMEHHNTVIARSLSFKTCADIQINDVFAATVKSFDIVAEKEIY